MEPVVSFEPPKEESDPVLSRVRLLRAFLNCNGVMFISSCSAEGDPVENNYTHPVYDAFLRHSKLFPELLSHCQVKDTPLVLTGEMGLLWSAVSERNGDVLETVAMLQINTLNHRISLFGNFLQFLLIMVIYNREQLLDQHTLTFLHEIVLVKR